MLELDTNVCEYLPDWFKQIVDYQALCQTESAQFELLADAMDKIADNFYFQTMGADAIVMWEKIFSIVPNPSTESLEFRRQRLLNRISTRPPFTLGFLYQKLDQIIGKGKWMAYVDYPNYTLYIESSSTDQQWAIELSYTLDKIKPAHIVYINRPLTVDRLVINESVELSSLIWNYNLGSWGLGLNPFATTETKEVVVVPAADSIHDALLNDIAAFVSSGVASARVNGSIAITNLAKSSDDNVAIITYTVTAAHTALVTQIELLNSSGEVLTTSPVYVPITDDTLFTHKLPIKEATE